MEGSGYGADKFIMVRNPDGTGSLKIAKPLDYEDPLQRAGFRFSIEVSDKVYILFIWMKFLFAIIIYVLLF